MGPESAHPPNPRVNICPQRVDIPAPEDDPFPARAVGHNITIADLQVPPIAAQPKESPSQSRLVDPCHLTLPIWASQNRPPGDTLSSPSLMEEGERGRSLVSERDRLCRRRSPSSGPLVGSGAGAGGAATAPLPRGVGAADAPGVDRCAEPPFPRLLKGVQGCLEDFCHRTLQPPRVIVPQWSTNARASPRLAKETCARTYSSHTVQRSS